MSDEPTNLTDDELAALEAMARGIASGIVDLAGISNKTTAMHATMLALVQLSNGWSNPGTEADNLEAIARTLQNEADMMRTRQ